MFRYSGGEKSCTITGLKQKKLQQQTTISSIYSNVFSTEFSQSSLVRMVVWWRWRNGNLSFVSVSLRIIFIKVGGSAAVRARVRPPRIK